jgi:hypothetical protein
MSKDKQTVKETKKAKSTTGKKAPSNYQSDKGIVAKPIMEASKKKK